MPEFPTENEFLKQLNQVIEENLRNDQFGVSELAEKMNMSRSNLLRKVKKETNISVSQLINQARLTRAMELLQKATHNVSEASEQVGFSSTSYFIKCFREHYGYPPGEVGKRKETGETLTPIPVKTSSGKTVIFIGVIILSAGLVGWWLFLRKTETTVALEKSIAVLPFKNESNDTTNVYLINGLMESTLNNLQKIKDLRVVSRTSSEKYRVTFKSIPEIAGELNVNYFVEGSGQKIGDHILLNIQLIDARNDKHLWAKQYRRETKDIFELQQELAQNIADEIEAVITPEEKNRIEKVYTKNLEAYDLFLKGQEAGQDMVNGNFKTAIDYFQQAIQLDPEFALAYAEIAILYYYEDMFRVDKLHGDAITLNADKALLYDSKLGQSLVAKAVDYLNKKEYKSAEPYLLKAIEYSPNSEQVISFLSDYYGTYNLNTSKYLEYALKGIQLDFAGLDSVTASYTCLRLGNALIQTGFVDESLYYLDKSLELNNKNPFTRYIRAFVLYAKTEDCSKTREILIEEYKADSSRFDILQDIGKVSYYLRDYDGAYFYYKQFLDIREKRHLDVYQQENMVIGAVMAKMGHQKEAGALFKSYKEFLDKDQSIYSNLGYAVYYNYFGDQKKAIEYMKRFAQEDNVQYWVILFLEDEPMIDSIKGNPEFKKHLDELKRRFWKTHDQLKNQLREKGLLRS